VSETRYGDDPAVRRGNHGEALEQAWLFPRSNTLGNSAGDWACPRSHEITRMTARLPYLRVD